jgi:A118 family predicted phage portal protein
MIKAIEFWQSMLAGRAPWLSDDVKSLGIEGGVVLELANTCTSEMESEVSLPELDEAYRFAIRDLNEELQEGLGLGSLVIKPLGVGGQVEYVTPDRFVPIKFDNSGKLVDVCFLDVRKKNDSRWNVRLERHTLVGGILTITNTAYTTSGMTSLGSPISLDVEQDWANLPEEMGYQGVERPVFGYFNMPKKNRVDGSRLGVSAFSGQAIELIRDADEQYGRLIWEMTGGELAVHVDPAALNPKKQGMDRLGKRLYKVLDVEQGKDKNLYNVFAPTLRDQSIINGLNAIKRQIEFATGLAYGDLSDVQDVAKTATEIRASKQRKYQLVNAIEANLKDCLDDLVYGLAFYMNKTKSGYDFSITFRDSILTDEAEEAASMREDVAAGILRPEKYLEKRYGVTSETMHEYLPAGQPQTGV